MGFPENFKIPVSDTQAYKQFGNSVVVPVVERIAKSVVESLDRPLNYRQELVLEMSERMKVRAAKEKEVPVSYFKTRRRQKARA